ncbi:MAG: c-type cytochrome [Burkholderiales bacterium]
MRRFSANATASVVMALLASTVVAAEGKTPRYDFGSKAGVEELAKFVSPLPDGRGLPRGSGNAAAGKTIYTAQCLSCHGASLEGGMGDRLIGGRGTLATRDPAKPPIKTVESYWPYATTLFDYIKRAMPLTTPGSLSNDEVYAVSAFILSQAKITREDAVINESTLWKIQMPNRDGFIPDPRPERFPPPNSAIKK